MAHRVVEMIVVKWRKWGFRLWLCVFGFTLVLWMVWAEAAESDSTGRELTREAASVEAAMTNINAAVKLFEAPDLAQPLRDKVVQRLLRASRAGASLPSRVLAKLPEFCELDAFEQRQAALRLAAACMREGSTAEAMAVYAQLLSFKELAGRDLAEVCEAYARALAQNGDYEGARRQYAQIMECAECAPHTRAMAALELVQCWRVEGRLDEAEDAYRALEKIKNIPEHLVQEAQAGVRECANLRAGRAAQDVEESRRRLPRLPEPGAVFFVAPKGRDTNPGTFRRPFATLERAREAVKAQRVKGRLPAGGVTVYLRGGSYAVTNTFMLGEADSGEVGAPVVYRAWRSEKPVLEGGFRVRGWGKVSDPRTLARLPSAARSKVLYADLKAQGCTALQPQAGYGFGIDNQSVRELFADGRPLQAARWPNSGFAKTGELRELSKHEFAFDAKHLARWAGATDAMASGYWYHLWASCTVPVKIESQQGVLMLLERPGNYGIKAEQPFYLFNLLEELDQPGEWQLDLAEGLLYLWPVRHPWLSEFVLSQYDKPFIQAHKAHEVAFIGLTLQHGRQHGVVLKECINCTVAGCVVRRMGGTAIHAPACANLRVYGNTLHTLGHTGMKIGGGDRRQLIASGNNIENNEVYEFGRCSRTYNPALHLEGCGSRVAHNHFHHAPSSAMRLEGNDHLIEFNDVHHVVLESDDQGGIDMWGNPSYRGVVMRYNHWHDIGGGFAPCGQAGIRFDDAISGMLVYGNLFERTSTGRFGGVQIHGGHHNIIDRNVFVNCRYGVSFSVWGKERWSKFIGDVPKKVGGGAVPSNELRVHKLLYEEVNVKSSLYRRRYPELADLGGRADYNSIWRNIFVDVEEPYHKRPAECDLWDNQIMGVSQFNALRDKGGVWCPAAEGAGQYPDFMRAKE